VEIVERQSEGCVVTPAEKWMVIKAGAAKLRHLRTFVETGTDTGQTTEALAPHFDEVFTIEVERARYLNAVMRFVFDWHITVIHGDSDVVLQRLCPMLRTPAVWWLDAHANGPDASGPVVCPTPLELQHILNARPFGHLIYVDDIDLFGIEPGYPPVEELERIVESYAPGGYTVQVIDTVLEIAPAESR
jgi:hypothetical protein